MTFNYSTDYDAVNYDAGASIKTVTVDIRLIPRKVFYVDLQTSKKTTKTFNVDIQTIKKSETKTFKADTLIVNRFTKSLTVSLEAKGIETKAITVDIQTNIPDFAFSDYSAHDYDTGGIQRIHTFVVDILLIQRKTKNIQSDLQTKQIGITNSFFTQIQTSKKGQVKTVTVNILPVLRKPKTIITDLQTKTTESRQLIVNIQTELTGKKTFKVDILPVLRLSKTIRVNIQSKKTSTKNVTISLEAKAEEKKTLTVDIVIVLHGTKTFRVDILTVKFVPFRLTGYVRRAQILTGYIRKSIRLEGYTA